ncbi:hypothetical protein BJX65DRAFT_313379 [Aspergillus insuetus]
MVATFSATQCFERSIDLNCTISFDSSQRLVGIGPYGLGAFPGDPDIAGVGNCRFLRTVNTDVSTGPPLALCKIRFAWRALSDPLYTQWEEAPESLESIVSSLGDQQLLTGFAYYLAFGNATDPTVANMCGLSTYHLILVSNITMLVCSSNLVVAATTNRLWREPLIGAIRIAGTVVMMAVACMTAWTIEPPIIPGPALLLPIACVSELLYATGTIPDSISITTIFGNIFQRADSSRSDEMGIGTSRIFIATFLWYLLVAVADVTLFLGFWRYRRGFDKWVSNMTAYKPQVSISARLKYFWMWLLFGGICLHNDKAQALPNTNSDASAISHKRSARKWLIMIAMSILYLGAYIIGIASTGSTLSLVLDLRAWLRNSEWVERTNGTTAEESPRSFGQLMAIFSLVTVVWSLIIGATRVSPKERRYEGEMEH